MRAHGFGERVVVPVADIYEIFHHCGAPAAGVERLLKCRYRLVETVNFTADCACLFVALQKINGAQM